MRIPGAWKRRARWAKDIVTSYPVSPILVIVAAIIIRIIINLIILPIPDIYDFTSAEGICNGVLSPLAEALFIAGVVALAVDPFIKHRFAKQIGKEMFWVLTNENAPESQRKLVEDLASIKFFYNTSDWIVQADWVDKEKGIISLLTTVISNCSNYDSRGYTPHAYAYVLSSTDDYESEYLEFRLSGKSTLYLDENSDPPISNYLKRIEDGSLRLDEKRIVGDLLDSNELPSDGTSIYRKTKTYRHTRGFFPMSNRTALQKQSFTLNGSAASDLDFSVTAIGTGEVCSLSKNEKITINMCGVYPFAIMSWHPKGE